MNYVFGLTPFLVIPLLLIFVPIFPKNKLIPIDVLILAYKRLNYLRACIESIFNNTQIPIRLIIIDNASNSKELQTYLQSVKQYKPETLLLKNQENMLLNGFATGFPYLRSTVFCLTDPDIVIPDIKPGVIKQLTDFLYSMPEFLRIGVPLDQSNIPSCWTKKEKKLISFEQGRHYSKDKSVILRHPVTTLQCLRTNLFLQIWNKFKQPALDLNFFKQTEPFGISGILSTTKSLHLGWNEYMDYPDYLKTKHGVLGNYKEVELL